MIHYVKGDLLETNADNICHQVNCQGKMNSGVAKAIREKWPVVYEMYKIKYDAANTNPNPHIHPGVMLGDIQKVPLYSNYWETDKHQHVVNFFSQKNYGYDGKRYTSYDAFWNCLHLLKQSTLPEATIAFSL